MLLEAYQAYEEHYIYDYLNYTYKWFLDDLQAFWHKLHS